jgi:phosphopantothenoylcysteine decarboxylase / phosphopantothenate---cysteine ligase
MPRKPSSNSPSFAPKKARAGTKPLDVLRGKTIVLAITGSIAAYKAVLVARLLVLRGARVLTVMTEAATAFVGPLTFSGITGNRAHTNMWDETVSGELHVELAKAADLVVIVPATADTIARLAAGRCDDLVAAVALSTRAPLLLAPSMHPNMWLHAATSRNVAQLRADGVQFVGPVDGVVASGDSGEGRMAEPHAVLQAIERCLTPQDLAGKTVLVTAGPTFEDWDPVRFLGNRSSGKMGLALVSNAAQRGAKVVLIAGPMSEPLTLPEGAELISVRSALEMQGAVESVLNRDAIDALVMAAAVADFRVRSPLTKKLKKTTPAKPSVAQVRAGYLSDAVSTLELVQNPDILRGVADWAKTLTRERRRPVLVGFALETGTQKEVGAYARGKLKNKGVDLIVANEARAALGTDASAVVLVDAQSESRHAGPKPELAQAIWSRVLGLWHRAWRPLRQTDS